MSELSASFRKRKVKKSSKNKILKRAKIFEEKNFDSSSDESTRVINSENTTEEFQGFLNFEFRPSKSENEKFHTSEIVDLDSENKNGDISSNLSSLTEKSFSIASDEDISYLNGSIVDCFKSRDETDNKTEIFSEHVFEYETISLKETDEILIPTKNKKEIKVLKSESVTSPPKQKLTPKEIYNFNESEQLYYTNDGIVLILSENDKLYLYGLCLISVLQGEIEILGHIVDKNSPELKLYSPRGSSLLYIQNVTKTDNQIAKNLPSLNISKKILHKRKCAIILCKKFEDPQISFIEKHISQQILPKEDTHLPRVVFQPNEGNFNLLRKDESWEDIINFVDNRTKLMICGGKGVGKTTFLRYAINKLLMKFSEIRVIDLDPGQSEFAVPGSISTIRVKNPIFGPNYTHLQDTEKSILSNINIAYEPDKYISSVKDLLKANLDNVPTLINFMGYTHGIGLNILSAVIMCVQPTDILQISSTNSKKNYKFSLEKDIVTENARLFLTEIPQLDYKLHQIESMTDKNEGWTAEPRQLREMCILAYLSRMLENDSIFKIKAPLHKISLNDIILCDLKGETVYPAVINACLVALCAVENQELNIFQCLGWGIVRGIDLVANELVLLASEKMEILNQVTHLVSSGVTLPPSIYMTPDEMVGHIPYVMEGVLMSFGQIPKRSRISAKNVNNSL